MPNHAPRFRTRRVSAQRAIVNRCARRFAQPLLAATALSLALWGCERTDGPGPAGPKSPGQRVEELITALTPIDRTVTSDIADRHFLRGVELTEELCQAGPEVGRAALAALAVPREKVVDIERGLLTVGARAATADALPLLEKLVTEYGAALDLRTEATLLLAQVAPERALVLLEGPVMKRGPQQTMPPAEFLLKAWVTACTKTGRSPVRELCDVATNLFQEEAARVLAVKELGNHPDPRGEKALRAILVESTGDGYLRRMAAQSLHNTLPAETVCEIFKLVASREADLNFARFLADALEKWCGS